MNKGDIVECKTTLRKRGEFELCQGDLLKVVAVNGTHILVEDPVNMGTRYKLEKQAVEVSALPKNFFELSEEQRAILLGVDEITDGPVEY